jgi:hypothetical protein
MKTPLSVALHEGHGFLQDQGWHQTAHLMTVAAQEIERLSARVRVLEDEIPARPDPHSLGAANHLTTSVK